MQSVPREWLDFLRQQFPKDSRIQLTEIGGNPRPISPGSTGKLDYIDDAGQFHVKWDNGCTLALVLGEDRFSVYLPEPQTFKLYMPLTADFYGRDEWGDMSEDGEEWDGRTLMDYEGQILSALVKNRVPEENESGLMHWYGEDDSVDHKVRSAVFTVEVRNRQLWGVAECRVAGELTPEELTILKEYLGGQASDGWGEGFEQRPIEVDGGELYVHLWQPDDWSIQTEQERFAPKVAEGLPELCFSTLRTTGQLICIKRGETGYYPSDWDTGDKEGNVELADELNEDLGVTPIQRQATVIHGRQQKMSPDTVAAFFAKYGSMAKAVCQEVPEHIHPHMMRHTRAMHLYQSGMPMVLLSQYLGHAQVETTMIYAYADTEMKRAAIQKADAVRGTKPVPDEIWADNEEMILKLSGLL